MTLQLIILFLLLLTVLVLAINWRLAENRAGKASRQRNAHAQWGEQIAEEILTDAGFEIVDRQVSREWTVLIDEKPVAMKVRADILATRDGHHYIVEVKTGEKAPDPCYPPTRRQLLEYAHVFQDHQLILLDAETEEIVKVEFPSQFAV